MKLAYFCALRDTVSINYAERGNYLPGRAHCFGVCAHISQPDVIL